MKLALVSAGQRVHSTSWAVYRAKEAPEATVVPAGGHSWIWAPTTALASDRPCLSILTVHRSPFQEIRPYLNHPRPLSRPRQLSPRQLTHPRQHRIQVEHHPFSIRVALRVLSIQVGAPFPLAIREIRGGRVFISQRQSRAVRYGLHRYPFQLQSPGLVFGSRKRVAL